MVPSRQEQVSFAPTVSILSHTIHRYLLYTVSFASQWIISRFMALFKCTYYHYLISFSSFILRPHNYSTSKWTCAIVVHPCLVSILCHWPRARNCHCGKGNLLDVYLCKLPQLEKYLTDFDLLYCYKAWLH